MVCGERPGSMGKAKTKRLLAQSYAEKVKKGKKI
jgi:hypothetical protein